MVAVAAEYQPEVLRDVVAALAEADNSLHAYAADASGLRLYPSDPDGAKAVLSERGYFCQIIDVIKVDVSDKPGVLHKVLERLKGSGIQIISTFGLAIDGTGAIYLRVDDAAKAQSLLDE